MAARRRYTVELLDGDKRVLATGTSYAMNSGVRVSEQLVREHAIALGAPFVGDLPSREGDTYSRCWVSAVGDTVLAVVRGQWTTVTNL